MSAAGRDDLLAARQVLIPGIIGGLGPYAHVEFERLLIEENTRAGAHRDQDHPVWLLASASSVPDRTAHLVGGAEDFVPRLQSFARLLEKAGADFLVVPCNTSHSVRTRVLAHVNIPWVDLIAVVCDAVADRCERGARVGILQTSGAARGGMYVRDLAERGLRPLALEAIDEAAQERLMAAIYDPAEGIKATGTHVSERATSTVVESCRILRSRGAEVVISGCTELSAALEDMASPPLTWIDPMRFYAQTTLDVAYGRRSPV